MAIAALEALTFGLGRMVAAAEEVGQRLHLLTGNRGVYRHELSLLDPDRLDVVDLDTHDVAACEAALKAIPDLAGLVNSTDTWLTVGADLAARLGLPGPDPDAVRVLRDKHAVRTVLREHGLTWARSTEVTTARDAAQAIGFPLVLKDSAGTGSKNVWPVRSAEELDAALAEAGDAALMGRLFAESLVTGPLFSAETLSWDGETRLLGVTGRLMSNRWFGREDLMSFPADLPRADRDAVADWVARVLAATGHARGFAHVEFVLTADGPELVEINARIGGCLAGEAMCRSLGTNVYRAVLDVALGERPALLDADLPEHGQPSAVVLLYPDSPGTFTGVDGVDHLSAFPGDPEWYPTMAPGTPVVHLGDQRASSGLLLAEADTTELAIYRALAAAGALRPGVSALP
ncbi:ATP-grasp domain-containing protein [Actinokineospora sp. PR83]|uniref:ATP-grasp domain-containing protein n=1 Tax=Actinokineospora sp. PR83 TaxID=2884908 RepID=UPI0027DEDCF7|nr:ATP-grasp domain-containing protein [Actinokineospora sp. PR83]MCG8916041.1 ATP-grasp domain-containing protein [Actinokineospora sp. PR83]